MTAMASLETRICSSSQVARSGDSLADQAAARVSFWQKEIPVIDHQSAAGQLDCDLWSVFHRDALNFETRVEQQSARAYECAGREWRAKIRSVDLVEDIVRGEVGTIDGQRNDVRHCESSACDRVAHSIENQARFVLDIRGYFSGDGIDADVPCKIKRIPGEHGVAEGKCAQAPRRRNKLSFLGSSHDVFSWK
jgi:hypothetical protein